MLLDPVLNSFYVLSFLGGALLGRSDQAAVVASPALVIKDVTVIDVNDGRQIPHQTVVIVGTRVQTVSALGQVRVPPGAQVVDGRGAFLIPGLWDMHAHVNRKVEFYPRYLANGVTGLRELAQRGVTKGLVDSFRVWQREVAAGTRVGPRSVGPSADLTDNQGTFRIATPADAERVIDSLKAAGMAFLKYHDSWGDPALFFAMARAARRAGLPLVGHVPAPATNVAAADSGLRSVEHAYNNHACWPDWPAPITDSAAVEAQCAPVAAAYRRNGTWVTPTLVVGWRFANQLVTTRQVVWMLRRLGVTRFLAGTDAPVNHLLPGFSLLEEVVEYLPSAGLTPLEALQAATLHPAQFFEATDSLGTVAPGKLADLVLLDANPLADIRSLMRIRAVVANGRYFDRAALDKLDPEGTTRARSYPQWQRYQRYMWATRGSLLNEMLFGARLSFNAQVDVRRVYDGQLLALLDSLGANPDTAAGYRRLAQLLAQEIAAYRAGVEPGQEATFDRGARMWREARAREGYAVRIAGVD